MHPSAISEGVTQNCTSCRARFGQSHLARPAAIISKTSARGDRDYTVLSSVKETCVGLCGVQLAESRGSGVAAQSTLHDLERVPANSTWISRNRGAALLWQNRRDCPQQDENQPGARESLCECH